MATLTFGSVRGNHSELANRARLDGNLRELGRTLKNIAYAHALEIGGRELARASS